ncbi:MAG: tRNA (N(6)-L-threonylcarbamoyladenosine(37)-C(2))-methylthiotransferase MtaB [Desulfobacterales bacterium]|nr:tRNA (N(6)-L-threonylcarbamoyladenosine(37)-C(2))-methylthiotransferase MtaB [Desulfobacterales bacterium]
MSNIFKTITLGCKVNQAETESLAAGFVRQKTWNLAGPQEDADLCIINTCAVTQKAAMQSRQAIRKAVRGHPNAVIVVTGCYAQNDPKAIGDIKGVDYVIGQGEKHRIIEIAKSLKHLGTPKPPHTRVSNPIIRHSDISRLRRFKPMPAPPAGTFRTRPFLKIQDGCNSFCTYCIVPYTRGRSRSLPADAVMSEFRALTAANAPEIVLTGVHIGKYGQDLIPQMDLAGLLALLESVNGGHRIRLSSVEPAEITDILLQTIYGSEKICPHFHIPLQSGDSSILQKMKRPYTPQIFAERIETIHGLFPDAAIGVDVIVGFPGEDDSAFTRTFELIEALPVTYLHVFPFSPRPGTRAAGLDNPVSAAVIKQRCRSLRQLGNEKKQQFFEKMTGKTLDVGIETENTWQAGLARGNSDNYIPVYVENACGLQGTRVACQITGSASDEALCGKAVTAILSEQAS